MAARGQVILNFLANTDQARKDISRLGSSLTDMGKKADDTGRRSGKLKGALKAGLAVAAVAAGAALAAAGRAMVEFGQEALADAQSAGKLADSLRTIPGITAEAIAANEDWISSMQLATHVSDTELRSAIEKLARSTGNLTKAQDLATIAADAAAGSGKSFTKVSEAMAKAASGNTTQLMRMYPWLDKDKDGTLTLKEATTGLGNAYKGAAKKAADRDPWNKLKIIWGELREALGSAMLPLLNRLGDWFKDPKNQKRVKAFIDQMADLSKEVGQKLVPALDEFLDWLQSKDGKQALRDMKTLVLNLASAVRTLAGWLDDAYRAWSKIANSGLGGLLGWASKNGGGSRTGGGGSFGRSSGGGTTRATRAYPDPGYAPPPSAPVIVTEEQVYRAVARLMLRGDARNGRLVRSI